MSVKEVENVSPDGSRLPMVVVPCQPCPGPLCGGLLGMRSLSLLQMGKLRQLGRGKSVTGWLLGDIGEGLSFCWVTLAMWWLAGTVSVLFCPRLSPGSHPCISDGSQKESRRELPANNFGNGSSLQFGASLF